jgi:hypothetical protein
LPQMIEGARLTQRAPIFNFFKRCDRQRPAVGLLGHDSSEYPIGHGEKRQFVLKNVPFHQIINHDQNTGIKT